MSTADGISPSRWINTLETFVQDIEKEEKLYAKDKGIHAGNTIHIYALTNCPSAIHLPITFTIAKLGRLNNLWKKLSIISIVEISRRVLNHDSLTAYYQTPKKIDYLSKAIFYMQRRAVNYPALATRIESLAKTIAQAKAIINERIAAVQFTVRLLSASCPPLFVDYKNRPTSQQSKTSQYPPYIALTNTMMADIMNIQLAIANIMNIRLASEFALLTLYPSPYLPAQSSLPLQPKLEEKQSTVNQNTHGHTNLFPHSDNDDDLYNN